MFDLEQSIAEWRKQMLAAGIKTPVPLEELEIHLREEIHRRINSGLNEADAFSSAADNIGQAQLVQNEFAKINMWGISMPADCKIFRLKAEPIFYFFRRGRGRMDVVRWPDIKRVRPCRMFNLRWLLIYTTTGKKIWAPLFLPKSQEIEFWQEIHRHTSFSFVEAITGTSRCLIE